MGAARSEMLVRAMPAPGTVEVMVGGVRAVEEQEATEDELQTLLNSLRVRTSLCRRWCREDCACECLGLSVSCVVCGLCRVLGCLRPTQREPDTDVETAAKFLLYEEYLASVEGTGVGRGSTGVCLVRKGSIVLASGGAN